MRFVETGPDIPSHLLAQQREGNVIFFCGAGVSMPAGLDSFWQLTDRIVSQLGAETAKQRLHDNWDFDRIFYLLEKDFDRTEIDREIFRALGERRAKTLANHRSILKLSRGAAGSTQLVTTNFDTLFERAGCRAPIVVPPNLPDLTLNQSLDGLVYLHGRLAEPDSRLEPNYVISSADFGRAYLAEGWAARFVKELRERFTLVFLGYSADDPPMRYLLEGLNNRRGVVYNHPIYAFAQDSNGAALEAWYDRGVTPVEYDSSSNHVNLWNTIHRWAEASANPEQWAEEVVSKALKGPRSLRPFERGQVVELISSGKGAAAFANAQPSPSSEWLCVFDPNARYAKPFRKGWGDEEQKVDPLELFGLDSDTPRPPSSTNRIYDEHVKNPLRPMDGDEAQVGFPTLHGHLTLFSAPLPPRLHHLARWFAGISHEPPAIWWASGWRAISHHLLWFVSRRLRDRHGGHYPEEAAHFWHLYLEHAESQTFDEHDFRWFEFEGLLKTTGWNGHALRYLERCLRPSVSTARPYLQGGCPIDREWTDVRLRDVVSFEVKVLDRHKADLEIPHEKLPRVVGLIRASFVQMVELLEEAGDLFWHAPNLHPTGKKGEAMHDRKDLIVLWFCQLFRELVLYNPALAKAELNSWPTQEHRLFSALRVWAASLDQLTSTDDAAKILLELSDEQFWAHHTQRGVLLLMKKIWSSLAPKQRRLLEDRLIGGPPRWDYLTEEEFRLRAASLSASRLRYLELNECALSSKARAALERLKKVDERWSDAWATNADESLSSRGGMIEEVRDAQGLEHLPIDRILDAAARLAKKEYDELRELKPFRGLVEEHPFKALSALRRALKDGKFPVNRWMDLLSCWPKRTSFRLRLLLALTIARMSDRDALELRHYTADWLKGHLKVLHRVRSDLAFEIFDGFLRPFLSADPSMTKSGIGQTSVGGEVIVSSEVSIMKAINSPIGKLTETLWSLTPRRAQQRGRLAPEFETRFARLTSVPGDGAGHAVSTLTKRLGWNVHCYEDWTEDFILPMFQIESKHAEAAWHGLVYNHNPLPRPVWDTLRSAFKITLQGLTDWPFDKEARRTLVEALVWLSDPTLDDGAIFSFAEVRSVLKSLEPETRGHALWALSNAVERRRNWTSFGKPFVEQAWPREKRYRSQEVTRGFLRLVEAAGDNFPDAVQSVKRLLLPVPYADTFTYNLSNKSTKDDVVALRHPLEALQLLDAITGDDRASLPFGLREALEVLGRDNPVIREMAEFRRLKALTE